MSCGRLDFEVLDPPAETPAAGGADASTGETEDAGAATGEAGGAAGGSSGCSLPHPQCPLGCASEYACVQCVTSADCGGATPVCTIARCAECADDSDCDSGAACHPRDHRCQPACGVDADCPTDASLCDATGRCVQCRSDADCSAARPVCDPDRGRCSQCLDRSDCSSDKPACDLQTGDCRECLVDADCPTDRACKPDQRCGTPCLTDDDCSAADGPVCGTQSGVCGPA
jgi:hypothetical protein